MADQWSTVNTAESKFITVMYYVLYRLFIGIKNWYYNVILTVLYYTAYGGSSYDQPAMSYNQYNSRGQRNSVYGEDREDLTPQATYTAPLLSAPPRGIGEKRACLASYLYLVS